MISIDTNVLVRVLVNDSGEKEQIKAARKVVSDAQGVFVSQIVQVETVWVLNRGYKVKKQTLIALLQHLSENIAYHLEKEDVFLQAVEMYCEGDADFSDYLILADAGSRGFSVVTFDKHFAKAKDTILVEN